MARQCSICAHDDREAIEAALQAGETLQVIAEQYGVSKAALSRHKKHIDPLLMMRELEQQAGEDTNRGQCWKEMEHEREELEKLFKGRGTVLVCGECGNVNIGINGWLVDEQVATVYCPRCGNVGFLTGLTGSLIKLDKKLAEEVRQKADVPPWKERKK